MAALKRPSRNSKIKKIQVENVLCTICQSILVEPVTLPCSHSFCSYCFKGTIENNALCCPLCRKRIGSWLRNAKRQNKLINTELWDIIQNNFSNEIAQKSSGTDSFIVKEKPIPVLCKPGEIRSEYEDALQKARKERLSFEQKHAADTQLLIRKLQQEDEAQEISRRLRPKSDIRVSMFNEPIDLSAKVTWQPLVLSVAASPKHLTPSTGECLAKHDAESSIVRKELSAVESPIMTDDNSSVCSSGDTAAVATHRAPAYSNFFKDFLDRKLSRAAGSTHDNNNKKVGETSSKENVPAMAHSRRSLPVSLPYTSLMSRGLLAGRAAVDTDSVDSMKQEFCCFKPINSTPTTIALINNKGVKMCSPVRVVGVRPDSVVRHESMEPTPLLSGPTDLHCTPGLPSAFVCLMKISDQQENAAFPKTYSPKKSQRRNRNSTEVTAATSVVEKRLRPESSAEDMEQNPAILLENLLFDPRPAKQAKLSMDRIATNISLRKSTSPQKGNNRVTNPSFQTKSIISSRNKNSEFLISSANKDVATTMSLSEEKSCFNGRDGLTLMRSTRRTSAARKEYYEQNGTVCSGDKLEQKIETTNTQLDKDLQLALKLDAEWNRPVKTRRYTFRDHEKPKRQLTLPDMMVGGKMKV